ncbi:MAG TPA: glutamate formimidoyltransferase, partial [Polyangiaceae bacterium]
MPTPLVECVPNFSEGRDRAKIKQITDAIESAPGVTLLNVEPGVDTHRTVVTFVGSPEAVEQAAFLGIARAAQLIDMSKHAGAHPRMGATDVCPFVPVEGVTMDECAAIARRLGERVGRELEIPVYLYEEAATRPERRSLSDIRRGEYEGLAKKLADPAWQPDFGPARFDPRAGVTVIGARAFLIAYNVNLNSTDKGHAADLAFALREKGRVARSGNTAPYYSRGRKLFYREGAFPCGSCELVAPSYEAVAAHCSEAHGYDLGALLRDNGLSPPDVVGKQAYRPGLFKACKAIGWYVEDYRRAQVSINLTDYTVTSPHAVLDACRALAAERGLVVTGSEIVGVVPLQAMMEAGRHYLAKQGRTLGQPVSDVLRAAVSSLGLTDVAPFEIEKKVLGLPVVAASALVRRTVLDFTDEVSRDSPAP